MKLTFDSKVVARFAIDFLLENMEKHHTGYKKISVVIGNRKGEILAIKSFGKVVDCDCDNTAVQRFNHAVETGETVVEKYSRYFKPAIVQDDIIVSCSTGDACMDEVFVRQLIQIIQKNLDLQQNWQ